MLDLMSLDGPSGPGYIDVIDKFIQKAFDDGYVLKECNHYRVCGIINEKMSLHGDDQNIAGAVMVREWLVQNHDDDPEKVSNPEVIVTFNPGQTCPIW